MTSTPIIGEDNNYNTNYNLKIIGESGWIPGGRQLSEPSLRSLDLVLGDVDLVDTRVTKNPRAQQAQVFIGLWVGAGPLCKVGACVSHKLLKHVDRHSCTGEYRSLHPNRCSTDLLVGRWGRKKAFGGRPQFVSPWHPPLDSGCTPSYSFIPEW